MEDAFGRLTFFLPAELGNEPAKKREGGVI